MRSRKFDAARVVDFGSRRPRKYDRVPVRPHAPVLDSQRLGVSTVSTSPPPCQGTWAFMQRRTLIARSARVPESDTATQRARHAPRSSRVMQRIQLRIGARARFNKAQPTSIRLKSYPSPELRRMPDMVQVAAERVACIASDGRLPKRCRHRAAFLGQVPQNVWCTTCSGRGGSA